MKANKRLYVVPQMELMECRPISVICSTIMPTTTPSTDTKPGTTNAPERKIF